MAKKKAQNSSGVSGFVFGKEITHDPTKEGPIKVHHFDNGATMFTGDGSPMADDVCKGLLKIMKNSTETGARIAKRRRTAAVRKTIADDTADRYARYCKEFDTLAANNTEKLSTPKLCDQAAKRCGIKAGRTIARALKARDKARHK